MKEQPKFNAAEAIKEINQRNIGGILKKKEDPTANNVEKAKMHAKILPLHEMSDVEVEEFLTNSQIPEEEKQKILDIIKKTREDLKEREEKIIDGIIDFEKGKIDKDDLIKVLEEIFQKNPELKLFAQNKIEKSIAYWHDRIPKSKNEGEIFEKIDGLSDVWNRFFENELK